MIPESAVPPTGAPAAAAAEPGGRGAAGGERDRAARRRLEEDRGEQEHAGRAQRAGEEPRAGRPGDRPQAAARGDPAEEAAPLIGREQIGHEAPEHRHDQEVEHGEPDEEGPRDRDRVDPEPERGGEQEEVREEEAVDERDGARARYAREQRGREGHRDEQRGERGGEGPVQRPDAAADPHLLPDRPQQVIRREQREEVGEREGGGAPLRAPGLRRSGGGAHGATSSPRPCAARAPRAPPPAR